MASVDFNSLMSSIDAFTSTDVLPADPSSQLPPAGLESTLAAQPAPAPMTNVPPSIWDTIKADTSMLVSGVESAGASVLRGSEDLVKGTYNEVKGAVGTVYTDVSAPIAEAAHSTYWYLILAVVVVAGGLYFVGKGGGIGQAAGFMKL